MNRGLPDRTHLSDLAAQFDPVSKWSAIAQERVVTRCAKRRSSFYAACPARWYQRIRLHIFRRKKYSAGDPGHGRSL